MMLPERIPLSPQSLFLDFPEIFSRSWERRFLSATGEISGRCATFFSPTNSRVSAGWHRRATFECGPRDHMTHLKHTRGIFTFPDFLDSDSDFLH
jgi:hypothetical protein